MRADWYQMFMFGLTSFCGWLPRTELIPLKYLSKQSYPWYVFWDNTVGCGYNAVQYIMILHAILQYLEQNINQISKS